jgi:CheY-like chemotaxis protein
MAHNELRHRASIVRELGPVPLVRGIDSRLGQVFLNLLMNAAQAIPEGAADKNTITVIARTAADGRAVVEIRDSGVGIAPENMRHIFEPFFTTKPRGIGTGLGLSICHNLITELGGEIDVESEVGRGTTVRVTLPASTATAVPSEPTPVPAPLSPRRRARILVIDDEPLLGRTLTRALRQHEVVAYTSARDALDHLIAGEQFDLILCDVMMPIMTGMEFHDELSRALPHLTRKVVFATGGAFTPAAREFFERTGNVKLEKPFDAKALHAIVDRIAWS